MTLKKSLFEKRRVKREKTKARHASFLPWLIRTVALMLAMAFACYVVINVMMDNKTFEISFYRVSSDKLIENMRTVLVSDVHMAKFGKNNISLLDAVARLKPDFISVTGDLNTYEENGLAYTRELCEQLVAIAPTYYALGNHELDEIVHNGVDYKSAISNAGVTLLHNKVLETTINGNAVVFAGMTNRYEEIDKYAPGFMKSFLSKQGYRIMLTHYPESFLQGLQNEDIDLAMCGHAHGGQVRLPYIGAVFAPDQGLLPELTEGRIEMGDLRLIISRGLGNSSPVPRINNKPELVVVDMCTY